MGKKKNNLLFKHCYLHIAADEMESNQSGYHSAAFSTPKLFLWAAVPAAGTAGLSAQKNIHHPFLVL